MASGCITSYETFNCGKSHIFYQDKPGLVIEIMTKFSLRAGLKEWGYKAHSAAKSELKQLHLRKTFIPMHRRDLKYE